MKFKKKKIRSQPKKKSLTHKKFISGARNLLTGFSFSRRQLIFTLSIVLALLFIFSAVAQALQMTQKIDLGKIFNFKKIISKSIGSPLKKDLNGNTNVLVFGTGGEGHDGEDLTDTIILASINEENGTTSLLSVPRDFYFSDRKLGNTRINQIYDFGKRRFSAKEGIRRLKNAVSEITDIEIQYYVSVNFQALVDIVDALEGIEIHVPETIYDTHYPNKQENGYVIFHIKEGWQTLDGETVLKYARSRKTTSDFSRSSRQHKILSAIREKTLAQGILTSPSKIKKLFNIFEENIDTDLQIGEILTLAAVASDLDSENIFSTVLSDDANSKGGFLYTPPRENYNGAAVLVPAGGKYDDLHVFADINLSQANFLKEKAKISVLNSTRRSGLATLYSSTLERFGFQVVDVDNVKQYDLKGKLGFDPKDLAKKAGIMILPADWKSISLSIEILKSHKFVEDFAILTAKSDQEVAANNNVVLLSPKEEEKPEPKIKKEEANIVIILGGKFRNPYPLVYF